MAKHLALYLKLAPEFGGTRFGPFEEIETNLGSADGNHIRLSEALGVAPHHVKILQRSLDNLILTPVDRAAGVYIWQGSARQPRQINAPLALQAGDAFALVSTQGPKFIVEIARLPDDIIAQRTNQFGGRKLSAGAVAKEGKRQIITRLLVTGPGQLLQTAWTFIVSGAWLQPRNLFALAAVAVGYVGFAFTWLKNNELTLKFNKQEEQIEELEKVAAYNEGDLDLDTLTVSQMVQNATSIAEIGAALDEDKEMLDATRIALKRTLQSKKYDWLVQPKSRDRKVQRFQQTREALTDAELPVGLVRLLAYAAAPRDLSDGGWAVIENSQKEKVCGRGPMALTWRQARALDLDTKLDGLKIGDISGLEELGPRIELLKKTANSVANPDTSELDDEGVEVGRDAVSSQSQEWCFYVDGDDERENSRKLARKLASMLGPSASQVPDLDISLGRGLLARLAKLYAADFSAVDFTRRTNPGIDLSGGLVGLGLQEEGSEGQWALEQTAEVIARSVAIPCKAQLEAKAEERDGLVEIFGEPMPSAINCLVMQYKLLNE